MKLKKTEKTVRYLKKAWAVTTVMMAVAISAVPAYADGTVQDSKIAKGTEKLIGDVTTWLMVLAPVVAGLLIIYFCIRRSAADEMDTSAATRCC